MEYNFENISIKVVSYHQNSIHRTEKLTKSGPCEVNLFNENKEFAWMLLHPDGMPSSFCSSNELTEEGLPVIYIFDRLGELKNFEELKNLKRKNSIFSDLDKMAEMVCRLTDKINISFPAKHIPS